MQKFLKIPIAKIGHNANNTYISKEVMREAIKNLKNIPIIDDNERVIGAIRNCEDISDEEYVYGNGIMWDKELPENYSFNFSAYDVITHKEDGVIYIDAFKFLNIYVQKEEI